VRRGFRAVGARTGLLSGIEFRSSPRDGDEVVRASATPASLAQTVPFSVSRDPPMGLGGKGTEIGEAGTTLVGEFFERYCAFHPLGDAFDRTTGSHEAVAETDTSVVPFDTLDTVDQRRSEQFGFAAFDSDTPVDWVAGTTADGVSRYVPTELVTLAPQIERTLGDRAPHFYASSNGCACGSTAAGATLRALYELVERDALMQTWYRHRTPDQLQFDSETVAVAHERVRTAGVEHTFLDLGGIGSLDVVGVVARATDETHPAFTISASASLDTATAAADAVVESTQSLWMLRRIALTEGLAADIDLTEQAELGSCPQYYARPENTHHVSFLTDGPVRSVSPPTPVDRSYGEALATVLSELRDAGVEPVFFDLTTPDIRELGMHVVRAVTPSLVDLCFPALPPVDHPALDGDLATEKGHPIP
jgi:ribosomal protein S12 methylthiotransferase accessory factor